MSVLQSNAHLLEFFQMLKAVLFSGSCVNCFVQRLQTVAGGILSAYDWHWLYTSIKLQISVTWISSFITLTFLPEHLLKCFINIWLGWLYMCFTCPFPVSCLEICMRGRHKDSWNFYIEVLFNFWIVFVSQEPFLFQICDWPAVFR